jgi:GntR family transcriptional regulator
MPGFLTVDPGHPLPLYAQLERGIRAAVATGRLEAGEQLPTVRQLAVELRVNANTVARVYADLERAGVLETRRGIGTFAARVQPAAESRRQRDAELRSLVARCLEEAAARGFTTDDVERQIRQITRREGG